MKKLIVILIGLTLAGMTNAQNIIYATFQPTDLGYGVRYDRQIKDGGIYTSFSKGNYKLPDGGYIRDHIKITLGGIAYMPQHLTFMTMGISYHSYGVHYAVDPPYSGDALAPISCELGIGTWFNKVVVSMRMDIIKWESNIDLGLKF